MRLEPGSSVALHHHTGEVHAFNLEGTRQLRSGESVGPGAYVYEPEGHIDAWHVIGEEPCVVHIKITGAVEYLDSSGAVIDIADTTTQSATYLTWCANHRVEPSPHILGTAWNSATEREDEPLCP
jgi:2,4'-dihydroxyacetophenone dioxygenase